MHIARHDAQFIVNTYRRFPVEIAGGAGMYLYDTQGRAYLDFLGGVAVNALGYGHKGVIAAITEQAQKYIHLSNYFSQTPQIELAALLCATTGYNKVFFCNSGTEASEGALKIARRWGAGNGFTEIITMTNSFHGRTMGSLSMMSNAEYKDGFGPFLTGCTQVPFNDVTALHRAVCDKTTGLFLECIQGEGGVVEISNEFAECISGLQADRNILVIADEVQSGIGRTGKFFGFEHYGLRPDIVTVAKPLGGGLPLGGILVSERLADVLQPGTHGSTFGGNPVACAAGKVVLDAILDGGVMANAASTGVYFAARLTELMAKYPKTIIAVRGKGLMVGCELTTPCKPVVEEMLKRGFLINCTHQTVLRFLPPLIVTPKHVDELCAGLDAVLADILP